MTSRTTDQGHCRSERRARGGGEGCRRLAGELGGVGGRGNFLENIPLQAGGGQTWWCKAGCMHAMLCHAAGVYVLCIVGHDQCMCYM